ncbi:MAG: RnfABCDGE type electron transport complex subunit D [Bacteroidales bacterium]|nr:RnfABCDGE type electron transport complex subunit D [Bacteroidales bacterium]
MNKLITVSPSPHAHSGESVSKLMYGVVIALLPAMLVSFWFFGMGAIYVTLLSVASCVLFEFLIQKYILKKEPRISDGSAIVTGVLLAFNLPSSLPPFIIIVGALVAIGIGKLTFGGLGNNPFNPALVGRVFLLLSFPTRMTKFPKLEGFNTPVILSDSNISDATTGATPLGIIKEGLGSGETISSLMEKNHLGYADFFMGNTGGSLGEIAAFALILGLIFMLARKIITWHIPVSIIGTVIIFTGILFLADPNQYADPLFHILTGGLLLGAIFMATDYVTSPMTPVGQIIYGVGIALITVIIRVFGAYPEGISFAILIMNAFVPLINRYIKPKRFGEEVKNG